MTFIRRTYPSALLLTALTLPTAAQSEDGELNELRQRVDALEAQLEATASAIENGMGTAGASDTTLGGYGELHYNQLDSGNELDFHRFVLFFGHRYSDRIRLHMELELEHALAGDGAPGEVELEQAAVEFDLTDRHTLTGGLFLLPVGILNETHEPPTFYGVERNPVEKNIIPTTWWEGGAMLSGEILPGWRYDLAVTSGLNVQTDGDKAYLIRNGRQKVAEASAEELAYTAGLSWTGLPGVTVGVAYQHQSDVTQSAEGVGANLLATHAIVQRGPVGLRALYASWDLDGDAPKAVGRDEQTGWYIEPSFRITPKFGVFARYNEWDNEAGNDADTKIEQTDVGVNFWPHPDVVIKADYQDQEGAKDDDGFNLAIGYQF